MAWDVDASEVLFIIAGIAYTALAVIVARTRPDRAENRWLAALLGLDSVLALIGPGITITTDRHLAYRIAIVWFAFFSLLVPVYFHFLATLPTSLSRRLRHRAVRFPLWAIPVATLALLTTRSELVVRPFDPTAADPWAAMTGPAGFALQLASLLVYLLGLVVALQMWRQSAPGTAARRQGAVFALAFGLHDAGLICTVGVSTALARVGGAGTGTAGTLLWILSYYGLPTVKGLFLVLLSYGILRVQLFDIDLKIKWTLGRGSALALLTATFFLVTETIEFFLPGEGLMANLVGAGFVSILALPAWRLGTRFANTLLPGVVETEEFRNQRRIEVYRASLESVAADGLITERERRILETMRTKLSISAEVAHRIETELLQDRPKTAPLPAPA